MSMKIVFMGTPEFVVPTLEILHKNFDVAAVITAPDKPAGRGLQLQQSAVKKYALEHNLHVFQPLKLKDQNFIASLQRLNADLFVVVAFRMLPEIIWNMPPKGTINLHASLLPDYRGAAPINWAIMNGEAETGLTTFFIRHEIDTGHILFQQKLSIGDKETAGELHDRMMLEGAGLVLKTVKAIEEATINPAPQPQTDIEKKAPKIFRDDCRINWNLPAQKIFDFIRGLSPHPTAWTTLNSQTLKIYKAEKIISPPSGTPGAFETDNKTYLRFACSDGYISVTDLQMEGKKRMKIEDFLRGYKPG